MPASTITPLPAAPLATDDQATFNARAFALVGALALFVDEANAVGVDAFAAVTSAQDALVSQLASEGARDSALAYAQAAGAAAGIPAPGANKILATDASNVVAWRSASVDPAFDAKLDKAGGTYQGISAVFVDKGTVASGTVTFAYGAADHQRVQASGNITLAVSGWPASGKSSELLLECVNFGGRTITWPTVNWVLSDGSTVTTVASNGVTWQASGTDFVLLWTRNGGTTVYGKVMR